MIQSDIECGLLQIKGQEDLVVGQTHLARGAERHPSPIRGVVQIQAEHACAANEEEDARIEKASRLHRGGGGHSTAQHRITAPQHSSAHAAKDAPLWAGMALSPTMKQ